MATATYTKLKDGTWGVRADGTVTAGESITVTKRDGSSKTETVVAVLWTGVAKDGRQASLVTIGSTRKEPLSLDGQPAILDQHWSSRGRGPVVRLCAGGCGRRVSPRYAECYSCHAETMSER